MANLKGDIKKLKRGELCGKISTWFCLAAFVAFVILFTVSGVKNLAALRLATLICAPVLIAAGAAVAAYCGFKYGRAIERAINGYVVDELVERAEALHPEKKSLTFKIRFEGTNAVIRTNAYKDEITLDFSAFGRLTLSRKSDILNAVETRITVTYCRLYERRADYTDVSYAEENGRRKLKAQPVIAGGEPDRRAFKIYLKNKS